MELNPGVNIQEHFEATAHFSPFYRERYPQFKDDTAEQHQPFSRSETNRVIEMTINKGTKTPGGITEFSTKIGAVKRWVITAPCRANI